jgi:hypothetical protein
MSIGHRIAITVIVVLVILLALAAYGYFTGRWEDDDNNAHIFGLASAQTRPELCMDSDTRERVRKIMLEALDEGLKEKIKDLFDVWLRDSTGQPARAVKGMDNALHAYVGARASAFRFNPPECSG